MNLSAQRLARLQRGLSMVLDQEWPQLDRAQRRLARLPPRHIVPMSQRADPLPIVATVATDGGENRLRLDPIRVQVVRVADSLGEIYFEEFIPESLKPDQILRSFIRANPRLQKLLRYLDVTETELLPRSDFQSANLWSMLRELMEWAALLKLASQPPAKLLLRDGLLRSVLLTERVFQQLTNKFQILTEKHGHRLVGVAKRSQVINYLTVALGLNETFADGAPAWLAIPAELEQEAAPAQYRWIGARAMGALCVARLDRGDSVPLVPVDVAAWQRERADEIMSLLHESARGSFPVRGYPMALAQAHEHARLGGLEIELLETWLIEQAAARDAKVAHEARQLRLLGRRFAEELRHESAAV